MSDCDRCDHPYLRHMPRKVYRKSAKTGREVLVWPDGPHTKCKVEACLCDMYVEHRGTPVGGTSFRVEEEA